jgi:outer membrane protein TolC
VSVSLGTIFLTPNRTKVARENVKIAQENIKQLKLEIREQVLTAYEQFKAAEQLFILQEEITADEEARFNTIEEQFKTGEISLDVYSESSRAYNAERRSSIIAEQDYNIAKIKLEKLIGVKLEEIR